MKRIYLILTVAISLLIACSENTTDNTPSFNGKYIMTVKVYDYDFQANKYSDTANYLMSGEFDNSPACQNRDYNRCFGKDWHKGFEGSRNGNMLSYTLSDGNMKQQNNYDNNNYLIETYRYNDGSLSRRIVYQHENGNIMSEEHYKEDNSLDYIIYFKYDNSGFISRKFEVEDNDTTSDYSYIHDTNGYLIKRTEPKYNDYTDYSYNSLGQLIEERDESGSITTYQYNSMGMVIEIKSTGSDYQDTKTIKYNVQGFPLEDIDENIYNSTDTSRSKTVYEYREK